MAIKSGQPTHVKSTTVSRQQLKSAFQKRNYRAVVRAIKTIKRLEQHGKTQPKRL